MTSCNSGGVELYTKPCVSLLIHNVIPIDMTLHILARFSSSYTCHTVGRVEIFLF